MKFSDVVPDRFKGPHHQEFSTWLRKVELAFRVTKTDDINKVDHLLAYMDPPAQDIAMQYAETYTREHDDSGLTGNQLKAYHRTFYDALIAHLKTKSAVVGTRPELRLLEQWKNMRQKDSETVGEYYHRLTVLMQRMAQQEKPYEPDELTQWTTFVNGLHYDVQLHVRTNIIRPGALSEVLEAAEAFEDVQRTMRGRSANAFPNKAVTQAPRAPKWGQFQRTRGTVMDTLRSRSDEVGTASTMQSRGAVRARSQEPERSQRVTRSRRRVPRQTGWL